MQVATEPVVTVCGSQPKSNYVYLTGSDANPYLSKGSCYTMGFSRLHLSLWCLCACKCLPSPFTVN